MKDIKCIISVGEPWNFSCMDGNNTILGSIINIKDDNCCVVKTKPIQYREDVMSDILILSPRTTGDNFKNIYSERIYVNGGAFVGKYSDSLSIEELKSQSTFVIIGGIRINISRINLILSKYFSFR